MEYTQEQNKILDCVLEMFIHDRQELLEDYLADGNAEDAREVAAETETAIDMRNNIGR